MKQIKLSGREKAVVRAIDIANGSTGAELLERTNLDPEDLLDAISALIGLGYAETVPATETPTLETFKGLLIEINPSYAFDLRAAVARL